MTRGWLLNGVILMRNWRCQLCNDNQLPSTIITQMITEAITALKERTGSSSVNIGKYMEEKHGGKLPPYFHKQLTMQLKKLVATWKLTQVENSFKLLATDKRKLAKGTKVAAKAAKPAVKPKASLKVKAKTATEPMAAATPKPKAKGVITATPKPRGRPPKAAKTSAKASLAKPAKKPATAAAAKKEKVAAPAKNAGTLKKVVATAPAKKSAAMKAKE
ncbi:hypothetical protein U9M48_011931 [Paspalum notatum var. saurae]|uniref:H15 domain-containing protein n=1 Tax=Paspalum notatum var. saurae TaxID=547442 RepID=A0AAQ3WHJ6_PASNO